MLGVRGTRSRTTSLSRFTDERNAMFAQGDLKREERWGCQTHMGKQGLEAKNATHVQYNS